MDKVSETEFLKRLKQLFYTGEKDQMELALMIAESNFIDLSPIEDGLKKILEKAELQPRLGQWSSAKMENLIYPLGMVLMLSIDETDLPELPEEIGLFRKIGIVELHRLGLNKLPSTIQHLKNLRSLSIKHNYLKTLPEEIGNLSMLKSLNLHDNHLENIPESFFQLQSLEVLELSRNPNLRTVPNFLGQLPSLKKLVLDADVFGRKIPLNILPLKNGLTVEWEKIQPRF